MDKLIQMNQVKISNREGVDNINWEKCGSLKQTGLSQNQGRFINIQHLRS